MPSRGASDFLNFFRRSLTTFTATPDGELLARYTATRDQAAFELLVRRHGPMVYGVARRALGDSHAAEDAFQATFLALARRAGSLRRHTAVSAWLYRVAVRVACRARQPAIASVPRRVADNAPVDAAARAELRTLIDESVDRLPEKLRRAVVLCYMSGHTTEQAAALLGCPRGTVLSRLATARERLRRDLSRRGVTFPTALLAAALGSELASASLPAGFVALAVSAAGPTSALSPTVVTLAQGALLTMSWSKSVVAVVGIISVGVIGFGLAGGPKPAPPGGAPTPVTRPEDPTAAIRERSRMQHEAELAFQQTLRSAADRRVGLKSEISAYEERVKLFEKGIEAILIYDKGLEAYQLAKMMDPQFVKETWSNTDYRDSLLEIISKAKQELAKARHDLYRVQEELQTFDQMTALRLDGLKRQYLAATP